MDFGKSSPNVFQVGPGELPGLSNGGLGDRPNDAPHGDLAAAILGGLGEPAPELIPPKLDPPAFPGDFPHGVPGVVPALGVFGVFGVFRPDPHPKLEIFSALALSEEKRELPSGGSPRPPVDASDITFASAVSGTVTTLIVVSGRFTIEGTAERGLTAGLGAGGASDKAVSMVSGTESGFGCSVGGAEPVSTS